VNAGYINGLSDAKVSVVTGSELDNSSAHSDLIAAGIGLTWTAFDGLKMFITYDRLKKLEEISELSAEISVENTIAKIIGSYYDIIRQGRVQQIFTEQVLISKFRLDLAKMQYETGTGSEMEYLKARVELNADVANLSNQQTLFENSKTTLNDLLSRDVNTAFIVKDTILVSGQLKYDSLRSSMKTANTNLLLAIRNKQVGQMDLKTARANQWPTLDIFANYNYYRSETEANFIQYNRNYGPSVGLSLNMKLFDGLNLSRQYKNAAISLQTKELEINQLENRLEAYLARIYNDYRNQIEMIGFEQENLFLAKRNMDIAKESYAIGSISSLQLREVQQDLLTAGTRLVTAEFKAKLTETELLLLSGKLLK
jgi:outer membrane protein